MAYFSRGGVIGTPDPLRPRDRNRFQAVYEFSLIANSYNNPGNLLSLNKQVHRMEQMGFGHSFGTVEKQGSESSKPVLG